MGPWRHSGVNYDGSSLGPLHWDGDTALQFRRDVLKPFFDQYLKDGAPKADTPPVLIYNTGENHWDRFKSWPLACESGCAAKSKPLYLTAGFGLSFDAPGGRRRSCDGYDEYVSDPAKPVPYSPRPVRFADDDALEAMAGDRSALRRRTARCADLRYAPLTEPLRIGGAPVVNLVASTSGTDSDWVVKLIDVYPDEVPSQPEMGGYELSIAHGHFPRALSGELRASPKPIAAEQPLPYNFVLPHGEPRVSARAQDHGASAVELVSAL